MSKRLNLMICLMALLLSGCSLFSGGRVPGYRSSSDFNEQVLPLTDQAALIKLTDLKTGEMDLSLAQVEWNGEPELVQASGYLIKKRLVTGMRRVAVISSENVLLADTVDKSARDPRYTLVNLTTGQIIRSANLNDGRISVPSEADLTWLPAVLYFDQKLVLHLRRHGR